MNGDCGWTSCLVRRKIAAVRFWNRLQKMNADRLTKRIFLWDKDQQTTGWAADMKRILSEIGMLNFFEGNSKIAVNNAWALCHELECDKWRQDLPRFPKLRTYMTFKNVYCVEPYIVKIISRKRRSILAKLRLGILPLEIETGRWRSVPINERICKLCTLDRIEDEYHFMFECPFYEYTRETFLISAEEICFNFQAKSTQEKWKIVMSESMINQTAKFVENIFESRCSFVYS
jgi:hypothetical protein